MSGFYSFLFLLMLIAVSVHAQTYQTNFAQTNQNYMQNSQVFRQEIARFVITVEREGFEPLPITQVPRVQQGDVLKVRLLDEAVNGIKLDQTLWDWTFLVMYINPLRRMTKEDLKRRGSSFGRDPVSPPGLVS